jgi:hypothetical protein
VAGSIGRRVSNGAGIFVVNHNRGLDDGLGIRIQDDAGQDGAGRRMSRRGDGDRQQERKGKKSSYHR